MIEIVSATRLSEAEFWRKSALGLSLQRLEEDARITAHIAFDNRLGLPEIYNMRIDAPGGHDILVFMHDDVWIDDDQFVERIADGLQQFDVIGVAGNRRRAPRQASWILVIENEKFRRDDMANLSGRVGHGVKAGGSVSSFGEVPSECELLDGVLLAARKSRLQKAKVRFDQRFDFHFYDMDFCRTARANALRLGTWPLRITHQSMGAYNELWLEQYLRYLQKWKS